VSLSASDHAPSLATAPGRLSGQLSFAWDNLAHSFRYALQANRLSAYQGISSAGRQIDAALVNAKTGRSPSW
jgi:hypothetical protein